MNEKRQEFSTEMNNGVALLGAHIKTCWLNDNVQKLTKRR